MSTTLNKSPQISTKWLNAVGITFMIALGAVPPAWAIYQRYQQTQPQHLPISKTLQVNHHLLYLEVALTLPQKVKGLSFRSNPLDLSHGMLFIAQGNRPVEFSLQGVQVPLDVWFIRGDRVTQIMMNLPPCFHRCPVYRSAQPIDYLVEVPNALSQPMDVQIGSRITIKP